MHIAVIDDSKTSISAMANLLSSLGHTQTLLSHGASEALANIKKAPNKFDVVFTDLNMPQMDGMELIRELGASKYPGNIVLVSDMDSRIVNLANDLAKQHKVSLVGNLRKPVVLKELDCILKKVAQISERKHPHVTLLTRDEIVKALSQKRIIPHYQPKLNSSTNQVNSVEILARISTLDSENPIMPSRFITTAEEHDLIDMLTLQLIETTAQEYPALQRIFGKNVKLSFNISPKQLENKQCPKLLAEIISYYKIPTESVIVEITEEHALQSTDQLESLNRLRMRGFGASMDDFGTGFTSLQQLLQLPFTELKIDRSLITNIQQDQFSQTVVHSIANITQQMGISLVAEGIESTLEFNYLRDNFPGILIQGYLISKPAPMNKLKCWYKDWQGSISQKYAAN